MTYSKDRKPHVPPGWIARWDDERKMWYYGKWTPVAQWEAPSGTFFPPENDSPSSEQTENGQQEALNQNMELPVSQHQNEYITSQKYQKLLQSDTPQSSSVIPMAIDEDRAPTSWKDTAKIASFNLITALLGLVLCFVVPFLVGAVLMFFVRVLIAIARKLD